jgi:hypothetical protein
MNERAEGATRVYGQSDDNIYFKGEFWGQAAGSEPDERNKGRGTLVAMSDGTLLDVKYGKDGRGIWEVKALRLGHLFLRIDPCTDDDAEVYSDVAHFLPGITWAYTADNWRPVG